MDKSKQVYKLEAVKEYTHMYLFIYVYIPRYKYINNLKLLLSASSSQIYTDE